MNIMMYGFDNNAFIDNNTMQRRMYLYSVDGFNCESNLRFTFPKIKNEPTSYRQWCSSFEVIDINYR